MKVLDADLSIKDITKSTIGTINKTVINALISVFKTIAVGVINIVTNDIGISLNGTLKKLGITFISFGKTTLTPHSEYFLFYTSLIYKLQDFQPSWA
jgi:hypothetical protein